MLQQSFPVQPREEIVPDGSNHFTDVFMKQPKNVSFFPFASAGVLQSGVRIT